MKLRRGFVSNSSSSSFILNIETERHYGDTSGCLQLYFGYFLEDEECEKLFGKEKWVDKGGDIFYEAKVKFQSSNEGYFIGILAENTTPESVKSELEKALSIAFEKLPTLFLAGDVDSY